MAKSRRINNQYRTVLMFFLSIVGITLLLSAITYTSVKKFIREDFYNTLKMRAGVIAKINIDGAEGDTLLLSGYANMSENSSKKLYNENDYIFQVESEKGPQAVRIADSLGVSENFIHTILLQGEAEYTTDKMQYKGILYRTPQQHFYVIASAENYFETHVIHHLQKVLIIGMLVAIIVAVLVSYYLSKNIFKPIKRISEKVRDISSVNLHQRLREEKYNNELNQLIHTFNEMLNRIETAFETQNNFISNASHELRTPLTGIIGTADVCLSKPRSQEEYIDTLTIILDEAEKLDKKTKALLFLAQTGFNGKVQKFETVRIDELVWDCISTIEKLNPHSVVQFDTSLLPENSSKLKVTGNTQLLHLAFTNIIINGCKYSSNQAVKVSIGASDQDVIIVVQDMGIGIPESEIQYIFDPFYRASNTKKFEGYGIGLPLTRNIIRMHHGSITIHTTENVGTTVQVQLPIKMG